MRFVLVAPFEQNKTLPTVYAGLPVFLTEAKMNFFTIDTTENLTARVEPYQANFISSVLKVFKIEDLYLITNKENAIFIIINDV